MARFLAIEWDAREARVALASNRSGKVLVEDAFAVPLAARDEGQDGKHAERQVGENLRAALAARRIRVDEALVAVSRSSIELKQLSFPPVPDAELPDMVRWQAMREFHSLGEDWPLDYLPIGGEPDQPRTVLAAAISPELVGQVQSICQAAGVKPQRVGLRPCAAAALFLRSPDAVREQVRVLIDVMPEEADLTVLIDRDVVFLRSARLPYDALSSPEGMKPLLAEIRRTLAAAHNQLGGRRVEAIYLCGTEAERGELVQRMEQELSLPSRLFDPLSEVQLDTPLRGKLPENVGRFAPLLGLLADEIEEAPHSIDFLHPRRPPAPPSRRNTYALAATAAAAVVLLAAFWIWRGMWALDGEIERLSGELKQLDGVVKKAEALQGSHDEIAAWTASDLAWLDEFYELSAEFPEARDAMLTQLSFSAHPQGGMIQLEGLVREAAVVDALEQKLRDARHVVEGKGRQEDRDNKTYRYQFNSTVMVKSETEPEQPKTNPRAAAQAQPAGSPRVSTSR
jgi:Tfp pilus assembly PilM family ATPase